MLGQGGMGTVYEVVRTTDERRLAAKILRHAVFEKAALGRFVREAQIMARLNHPNLVAISDVDVTTNGILYLVMELVEGHSLAQLRERFSDVSWSREVLAQVAEALAALHSRGIVHRDVKPENVLVADEGMCPRVKLEDFGIARLAEETQAQPPSVPELDAERPMLDIRNVPMGSVPLDAGQIAQEQFARTLAPPSHTLVSGANSGHPRAGGRRTLTQTGVVLGTPGYMAPELLHGASQAQPSADIYSLGVIAVEMFTGKRPAAGRSPLVSSLNDSGASSTLRNDCPGLDATLIDLLERALASDPVARPSAAALVLALNAAAPPLRGT